LPAHGSGSCRRPRPCRAGRRESSTGGTATLPPGRVPGGYPEEPAAPTRRAGNQVVGVGRVHQDLPVLIATTPLPHPVHAVTRPPEQVVCHGDLACAVVIVGVRVLGHCPCLTRASA
jgi:hypothetical protein